MRHTAVYYQRDLDTAKSKIILIQPPDNVKRSISTLASTPSQSGFHICLVILLVLLLTERDWRQYLIALEQDFSQIVSLVWSLQPNLVFVLSLCQEKLVLFSKVGRGEASSFSVSFHDCQRLQRVRRSLDKSAAILDNCMSTANSVETFIRHVNKDECNMKSMHAELQSYKSNISVHRRTLEGLLNQSSGAMQIVGPGSYLSVYHVF